MSKLLTAATCVLFLVSCQNSNHSTTNHSTALAQNMKNNPFLEASTLQYQAPQFDKISDADFEPAFLYGMERQIEEWDSIANNPAPATFENTLAALETSGAVLTRATAVFFNLTSANTNPTLQALEEKYAPIFSAHSDKLFLNDKLYQRIKTVYDNRNQEGLQGEDLRLAEYYMQNFNMHGAALAPEKKEQLKKLNEELATLQTQFSNKLLEARKVGGLLVDDVAALDGMTADDLAAASADAKAAGKEGKYLLALQNTTQQPLLQNLKVRDTRAKLFDASVTRAQKGDNNDTRETFLKIARLRLQKAQLMNSPNYAAWKLQDQMAQTPENALHLLEQLATPAVKRAATEAADIQKLIDEQKGNFKLAAYDWNFYAEQVRKAKYDLDESQIKPYFEVRTVLEKGVFYAAEKLYGISFKPRPDLPVYNPDVIAYEVFDADGSSLAIYYLDFYARDNKNGGAWMNNFVNQSHVLGQKPVIVNVYNYQKPAPGKPSLISYDDVTTLFHEFGHSIHGMFANQKWPSLSGTNTPRDFVEFPSQINEQWALEPTVLKNYAVHYETKQPIPQALIDKLKKSRTFNEGYSVTELAAAATLDMAWHTTTDDAQMTDALQFETNALKQYGLLVDAVPPRYHSPYFLHIWANGYDASYYAYMWSEMLDFDAFKWFQDNGGMTRANGDRFRKYILSVGNGMDLNVAFKNFTGHDPSIEPLLIGRGLK